MTYQIIDRRKNDGGKSSANRQRFLRRVKDQVREAAKKIITDSDIKDLADGKKKKKVTVPAKDLKQYQIHHGQGGENDLVHPGNKEFVEGDRFSRPPSGGGGQGNQASMDGDGEDEFVFELTQEEFLDLFFEECELPDMVKESIKAIENFEIRRAGFVNEGNPARLNIERSMRKAKGRRTALRGPKKRKLKKLEAELEALNTEIAARQASGADCELEKDRRTALEEQIRKLKRRIKAIPFVDDLDLQFNNWTKHAVPSTQAVMFCLMDVSGSMGAWEKEMAKRFYLLLYLFLLRSYEKVEIVYIRHHTTAKEVDHDEFFYSRETGGTVVSSALDLMLKIVKQRFNPEQWNIYACQASDGDNWGDDTKLVDDMLRNQILKMVQYYAYVELRQVNPYNNGTSPSDLWETYEAIKETSRNFDTSIIHGPEDVFTVFQRLFDKNRNKGAK